MNFPFLSGSRKALAALSWTLECDVDLKYDVLCLWVFVYGIFAWVGRSKDLKFVLVRGTACAN